MRISLWQQFSSNNSSAFVLVGRFQSNAEAQRAYDFIHSAINQIAGYYRELPKEVIHENRYKPSEVEIALFESQGVEIKYPIDWLFKTYSKDKIVSLLDQYVIVSDPSLPNWSGEKPFDELMLKLGGEIYTRGGRTKGNFRIQITCIAPEVAIADKIYDAFLTSDSEPIPWLEYHGGEKVDDPTEFGRKYQTFLAYAPLKERKFTLSVQKKSKEVNAETHRAKLLVISEQLTQVERELSELEAVLPPLTGEEIHDLIDMRQDVELHKPIIHRHELELTVEFWGVGNTYRGMTVGLPAVVAWLKELGCEVNIDFKRSEP